MSLKNKILISLCCFIGMNVLGGGSTGGGNVVVCKDASTGKETIRLLDYYEGEMLFDLIPDLGSGTKESEMVKHVTDRLVTYDKARAEKYQKSADAFMKNTRFVTKVTLPNINDHAYVPLESDCKIEQIAVQNISPFPQSKKFTIRQDFWTKLSTQDKAGLILHEIIYEEALKLGHTNSKSARYFNSLISSAGFEKYSDAEYQDRLELIGFEKSTSGSSSGKVFWFRNPVKLSAIENQTFSFDLRNYLFNHSGGPLKFSMSAVHRPNWLTLSSNGELSGTPKNSGSFQFIVNAEGKAQNAGEEPPSSFTYIEIQVTAAPAVKWKQSPIPASVATEGVPYAFDLTEFAVNEQGGPLKFLKLKGPSWIWITSAGILMGIPSKSDIGPFTLTVEGSDGSTSESVDVSGEVKAAIGPAKKTVIKMNEEIMLTAGTAETISWMKYFPAEMGKGGFAWEFNNRPKFISAPQMGSFGPDVLSSAVNSTKADVGTYPMIFQVEAKDQIYRLFIVVEVKE